jgi:hypothetical protein
LQAGEVGLETDTGRFKIGNGTSVWQSLPYYLPDNNPSNVSIRQGKNLHDVYAKLSPLAESYSQTFTGSQVLVPNAADRTPLIVAGAAGQTGILQLWRTSAGATLASVDHTGKLTAAGGGVFSGQVNVNNNKIINLAIPTEPKDAVTKEYVDEIAQGLSVKPAVQAATTENLVGTYTNGTAGVGATLNIGPAVELDIDGWTTWELEDGVLVKDQTNKAHNGRYYIYQVGDVDTDWILIRCTACDEQDEIPSAYVFVQHGDTYANTGWVAAVEDLTTFEVGVDDITWVQFSGAGTFTAGDGLVLDGPEFNVVGTADRITANADSIDIASTYVGQASITTLGTVTTGTWSADVVDETKGGTGQSSYTIGDVLYADTTTSLAKLSPGTASYALLSGGSGTAPSYGQIQTGAIANDAVTYDKLQNVSSQYRVLGRISSGSGNAEELTPDQLMQTINQGITDIAFSLIPVGTTSTTVAQGDHTHTLDQLSDVVISTPALRQVLKYNGTNWINELPSGGISIGATPPEDASSGDAWFDSTDGSLYVYYDDGVGGSRTNLITNPSFQAASTTGWTGVSASTTVTAVVGGYSGNAALGVTPSTNVGGVSTSLGSIPTSDNDLICSAYVYPFSSDKNLQMSVSVTGEDDVDGDIILAPSNTWTRISVTVPAAIANTVSGNPTIYILGTDSTSLFLVDAVLAERATSLGSYFDGSTAGASWTGTANESTSTISSSIGSAQWVQVKANSALEASILTRVSALEARSTDIEAANAVRVADEEDRDSVYPAPVQGNTVFRADLGYEEKYYAAYNATTNPDGTTGTPGWYRYAGGAPLSQNYLINGGFDIWQRGTSFTATGYNADRWSSVGADITNNTVSRSTSIVPAGDLYSLSITKASTAGVAQIRSCVETINAIELAGKTATFSVDLYASASTVVSLFVDASSSTDLGPAETFTQLGTSDITVGSFWNKGFVTVNIPSDTKTIRVRVRVASLGVGTTLYIANAQLEQGPVPTPFRRNQPNIQAELAACQRYYYRVTTSGATFGLLSVGAAHASTSAYALVRYPVKMRVPVPLSNVEISNVALCRLGESHITVNGNNMDTNVNTEEYSGLRLTVASASWSIGDTITVLGNNNSAAYLGFSAEL